MTLNDDAKTSFSEATVTTNASPTISSLSFTVTSVVKQTLYLRAHVVMLTGALETIYTEEVQFEIDVTDPCGETSGVIRANAISPVEYWIGDGS